MGSVPCQSPPAVFPTKATRRNQGAEGTVARWGRKTRAAVHETITRVAAEHGVNIEILVHGEAEATRYLDEFTEGLQLAIPRAENNQVDVAVFGSLARREVTRDSDCDYLVVIDGTPDPESIRNFIQETDNLRNQREFAPPGSQSIFGEFASAGELLGHIGLNSDSNINTTRRVLFLIESASVYDDDLRRSVREKMLRRYCRDYQPQRRPAEQPIRAPHFLLNDLIRYWRTVAVDFGAKQWNSIAEDWGLRYAKLITSRKIMFAGSLMALVRTAGVLAPLYEAGGDDIPGRAYQKLLEHLSDELDKTPLARLMSFYPEATDQSQQALAAVLTGGARFCECINERGNRVLLSRDPADDTLKAAQLRQLVEDLGTQIQQALETIFFDDPALAPYTRAFGLF
jgi:predicted nucleotidyltransferase